MHKITLLVFGITFIFLPISAPVPYYEVMKEEAEKTVEEIKALVKDAKFVCKVCGRAAAAEENLCEPVPI